MKFHHQVNQEPPPILLPKQPKRTPRLLTILVATSCTICVGWKDCAVLALPPGHVVGLLQEVVPHPTGDGHHRGVLLNEVFLPAHLVVMLVIPGEKETQRNGNTTTPTRPRQSSGTHVTQTHFPSGERRPMEVAFSKIRASAFAKVQTILGSGME